LPTSTSDQQKVRKVKEFALYRGDQFLGMGTYKELSEISGLSISTLQKINGKFYQKQCDDYNTPYDKRLFLIHVGYTDDF